MIGGSAKVKLDGQVYEVKQGVDIFLGGEDLLSVLNKWFYPSSFILEKNYFQEKTVKYMAII